MADCPITSVRPLQSSAGYVREWRRSTTRCTRILGVACPSSRSRRHSPRTTPRGERSRGVTREITFAPEALTDRFEFYNYIEADSGTDRARNYTDRIVARCRHLVTFPERSTLCDDLRPMTYRRRVTIAVHITTTQVVVDRILYGGRDLSALFEEGGDD